MVGGKPHGKQLLRAGSKLEKLRDKMICRVSMKVDEPKVHVNKFVKHVEAYW